jgi:hypothetical protein
MGSRNRIALALSGRLALLREDLVHVCRHAPDHSPSKYRYSRARVIEGEQIENGMYDRIFGIRLVVVLARDHVFVIADMVIFILNREVV